MGPLWLQGESSHKFHMGYKSKILVVKLSLSSRKPLCNWDPKRSKRKASKCLMNFKKFANFLHRASNSSAQTQQILIQWNQKGDLDTINGYATEISTKIQCESSNCETKIVSNRLQINVCFHVNIVFNSFPSPVHSILIKRK